MTGFLIKRFFMKIYLLLSVCVLVLGAYFYGAHVADAKCNIKNLQNNLNENIQNQKQFIDNQRIIHETVYKTGVADVRRILRDKYTIAD